MSQVFKERLIAGETGTDLVSSSSNIGSAHSYAIALNWDAPISSGFLIFEGSNGLVTDSNADPLDWEEVSAVDFSTFTNESSWLFNASGVGFIYARVRFQSTPSITANAEITYKRG